MENLDFLTVGFIPISPVYSVYPKQDANIECQFVVRGILSYRGNIEERIIYLDKNFMVLGKDRVEIAERQYILQHKQNISSKVIKKNVELFYK